MLLDDKRICNRLEAVADPLEITENPSSLRAYRKQVDLEGSSILADFGISSMPDGDGNIRYTEAFVQGLLRQFEEKVVFRRHPSMPYWLWLQSFEF